MVMGGVVFSGTHPSIALRMVMGGVVFSGTLPSFGTRRCALSVGNRTRFDRLPGRSGGSCAPKAVPSLRASRATPPPPIPQLRLVQGRFAPRNNLITHHSLLITHLPSPITHLPSPITHLPSPITHLPSPISHYSSPISHLHYSNPQIILIISGWLRKIFGIIDARKRRILCI
jgi:hypothetical protein